tara:strand:+ start:130 stop:1749 length:1620 start_codon:yes stop_codon:yes gene_type:complete
MAEYEIEYPKGSGELYDITAPDDATDAQIEKAFFEFLSDERGIGGEALRKSEFGARGFVDAVTDTAAAIPEIAAAIPRGINTLTGLNIPVPPPGYYGQQLRKVLSAPARAMGLSVDQMAPKVMAGPMTAADKIAYGTGKGAGAAASIFAPAAALAQTARQGSVAQNALSQLAQQKALQTAAGVTGGVVEARTDSPMAGMAASMAVPFLALVPATVRNATAVSMQRAGLKKTAPTSQVLKAQKQEAYRVVDDIEGEVKPNALQRFRDTLEPAMENVGFDKFDETAKPRAVLASIERMIAEGKSLNLKTIENIRKRIGKAIQDTVATPGDNAVAMTMRDQFDAWFEGLAAKDITVRGQEVVGPVVENAAATALKAARDANVKFRKSETIEEIVTNAEGQASGFENGLRIGFRQLLKNKKRIKGFSEDERQIMREIRDGNAGTNLARLVGKFGFNITGKGSAPNIVGAGIGGAAGYQYDPLAAIAVPAAGTASKFLADRLARNTADYLRAMAATGGKDVAPRSRISPRPGLLGAVGLQNLVP